MIKTTQIDGLLDPLTDEARKLMISKLFLVPINHIIAISQSEDPSSVIDSMERYRLYSAHDFQIANIIYHMNRNYNFTYVKYASNFYFELYKDSQNAFFVRTMYNGDLYPIEGCPNNTIKMSYLGKTLDGLCPIQDFVKAMNDILVTDPK